MGTEEEPNDLKEQLEQLRKVQEQLRENNSNLKMELEGRDTTESDLKQQLQALQDSEEGAMRELKEVKKVLKKVKKQLRRQKTLAKNMRKLLHDFDLEEEERSDPEVENFGGGRGPNPGDDDETESNQEDVGEDGTELEGGGGSGGQSSSKKGAKMDEASMNENLGKKRRRSSKNADGPPKKLKADESSQLGSPGEISEANANPEGLVGPPSVGERQPDEAQGQGTAIAGGSGGGILASSSSPALVQVTPNNVWTFNAAGNYLTPVLPPSPDPTRSFFVLLEARFKQISEMCLSPIEGVQEEGMRSLMLDPNLTVLLPSLILFINNGIVTTEANRDVSKLILLLRMISAVVVNHAVRLDQRLATLIPYVRNCILTPDICGSPQSPVREIHWEMRAYAGWIVAQLCQRTLTPRATIREQRDIFNSFLLNPLTPVGTLYGAVAGLGELGNEVIIQDLLPNILGLAKRVETSLRYAHSSEVHKEGSMKIIVLVARMLGPVLKSINSTQETASEYKRKFGIFGDGLLKRVVALREEEERLRNQAPNLYSALTAGSPPFIGVLGLNAAPVPGVIVAPKTRRGRKRKTSAKEVTIVQPNNTEGGNGNSVTEEVAEASTSTSAVSVTPSPEGPNNVAATGGDTITIAVAAPKRRGRKKKTLTSAPAKDDSASANSSGGSDPSSIPAQADHGSDDEPASRQSVQSVIDTLVDSLIKVKEEDPEDRDDDNANGKGEQMTG